MSLQATLRARMSLRQTWRWATSVSLLRTCWSLSYLTASSRSAFWVSPSIWMSCFSWTAPGNDLAWWCLRPSHFCPTWGSSSWVNFTLGLTSGLAKALQCCISVWCFPPHPLSFPLSSHKCQTYVAAWRHSLPTPVPAPLYLSQALLPINVCTSNSCLGIWVPEDPATTVPQTLKI